MPPPTDHWQLPDGTARPDAGDKYGRVGVCLCLYIGMWQWMMCVSAEHGRRDGGVSAWIRMDVQSRRKKCVGIIGTGLSVNRLFCLFLTVLLSHLRLVTESYMFGWLTVFIGKFQIHIIWERFNVSYSITRVLNICMCSCIRVSRRLAATFSVCLCQSTPSGCNAIPTLAV